MKIPNLPREACKAHIIDKLASGNLISLGQLCDVGCKAYMDKNRAYVIYNDKIILQGRRSKETNGLWEMELPPAPERINAAVDQATLAERIKFIHASLFSPTLHTWAVKKGLKKAIEPSPAVNNTTPHVIPEEENEKEVVDKQPTLVEEEKPNEKQNENESTPEDLRTQNIYVKCEKLTGQCYTDQTGRMTVTSVSGMNSVLVAYDYDSNLIWGVPMPSRTAAQIVKAYKQIYKMLQTKGFKPKLQRLDNECAKELKDFFDEKSIEYQLTPAGKHSRNLAEKAIQTWKDHFIAGLSSTHPNFPVNQWCKLIEQANITLCLLRPSRINPQLSAYAQCFGVFDYQKTPLAPPGMKVLAHVLPKERQSFAPHVIKGFSVGPAMNHYRCFRIFIPDTGGTRISDTLRWFPHNDIRMPIASEDVLLRSAVQLLRKAIKDRLKNQVLPPLEQDNHDTLTDLNELFQNRDKAAKQEPQEKQIETPVASKNVEVPRVQEKETSEVPRVPKTTQQAHSTKLPRVQKPSQEDTTTSKVEALKSRLRRQVHKDQLRRIQEERNTHRARATRQSRRERKSTQKSEFAYVCSTLNLTEEEEELIRQANEREEVLLSACEEEFIKTQFDKHYLNAVLDEETGKLLELRELLKGKDGKRWSEGSYQELSRLHTGCKKRGIKGTNTIEFITPEEIPKGKKGTYARICADFRPQKEDPFRVRITVGGDKVQYEGETYTPTADITTAKVLFNSVLSTPLAKFMNIDIKDFYLETPMNDPEYMWLPRWVVPQEFIDEHDLEGKFQGDRILVRINKGMYGLPQAGRLAYVQLVKHLRLHGYERAGYTPGLFKHKTRGTVFSLVVDDFGVRYTSQDDANHLINALEEKYTITKDFEGKIFLGLHLDWDYKKRIVRITMPDYVKKALAQFQHKFPTHPQHSPHPCAKIKYGEKVQYAKETVPTDMTKEQLTYCQQVIGVFLFYARAIDSTMLPAIGSIAAHMSTSTWREMKQKITHFLDYAATHPDAEIVYKASNMHLWIHTDASYLTEPKARSRAGGYHYFSSKPKLPIHENDPPPPHNHPVFVLCKIIEAVMSSTQESETGGGYMNAKEGLLIRQAAI
ncbi:hypothetical protein CTEN210_06995 [Chaetoceros tenuissimus]|uniref:Integrase catalytic domain-containing protein n=1 Tax=Chaetoceros tenuissimus TaxID=426638 RepID=A0AAD3CTV4_9STRA|nr:hypothetical protein CTEN210_06995 [Chaetoceros tenuissimus]